MCLAGEGSKHARVMIIGEAPGADEDRKGRPLVGKSGQELRAELRKHGIRDSEVFITNTVRCRPPGNDKPSVQQMKACREYLDYEIARIQPEFVVTLGATATKALFSGKTKVSQHHGTIIEDPKYPFKGFITYHPAAMLHNPAIEPIFRADMARLGRAIRGEIRDSSALKWNLVRRGNFRDFIREFKESPEFSFDLETSQLFQHDGKGWINAIIIGLPSRTWVIPLMRPGYYPSRKNPKKGKYHRGSPWGRGEAIRFLMQALFSLADRGEKTAIAHNGKFDNIWLRTRFGRGFRLSFDTMLASHTLDENRDHDLKTLSRVHLDASDYDLSTKEKKGNVDPMKLYQYGAYDGAYTLGLYAIFEKQLKKERELHRLFYSLVMPAARAFEEIECEGKTLDLKKMEDMELELLSQKISLRQELDRMVGKKINWNSPAQIAQVLYGDLGLECTVFTDKGAPSTSENAVIDLKGKHPVVDKLIEYREVSKFLSTYIVGLRQYIVGDKLYISYKLHGTVTGRYASRLHSIPRDGRIRNLVTAPPGWKFVQADVSQAELRIITHLSGDLEMRRCFTEGIDIHWRTLMFVLSSGSGGGEYITKLIETAEKIQGQSKGNLTLGEAADILLEAGHETATNLWKGWKEGRKRAKAVNFGYVYGMFEKKFIQTAKTKYGWEPTWDEAHQNREAYFQLYSQVPKWHDKQKKLVRLNGFVRMLSGRRRRLPDIYSSSKGVRMEAERQAINSPVQGFIGDYKAMCLVEIHEDIDRSKLRVVGEHHDAILMIVREGSEDQVLPKVLKIIRKPKLLRTFGIRLDVPMDGEIEVGPWGAGKTYPLDTA